MTLTKLILASRRVDAHLRAIETMKRRGSIGRLFQRRYESPIDMKELFQLTEDESLQVVCEMPCTGGTNVERLEETYKGFTVYDAAVTVRKTQDGQLTGDASGTIIQNIVEDLPDEELEPRLSDVATLDIVLFAEGDTISNINDPTYNKLIYIEANNRARFVNMVSYLIDGVKRPFYIICLQNGEILEKWQGLKTYPCCERNYKAWGGNEKTGLIKYGDMPHCLTPTIRNGTCYLENEYVRVVDMLYTRQENITETASFDCEKGYGDEINGAYSPAVDAFFYGTVFGKMFEEWFGMTPLNYKVVIRVHIGCYYERAFWNGHNASFGDGGDWIHPLTSLDTISHEVAHGFTEQKGSRLAYTGETGGVDEAFSDIMGEAAEAYLLNSDFLAGSTIIKDRPYMREFERPERDNMSISKIEDIEENMSPHRTSGVYRRIWWVVVKDGGISIRDAATTFLRANRLYWHNNASFFDCSCGILKAALDLGLDTAIFRMAFRDVGLEYCNVNTHVFGLKNNYTIRGILVSDTVSPVFKMELPEWADNLILDATIVSENVNENSCNDANIFISVMTNGWELSDNPYEGPVLVAEGVNRVKVHGAADNVFFFKLAVSQNTNVSPNVFDINRMPKASGSYFVNFTARYTCLQYYTSYSWENRYMYSRECASEFYF